MSIVTNNNTKGVESNFTLSKLFINSKTGKPDSDFGLLTLKAVMGIGVVAIIIASIWLKRENSFLPIAGLSLLVGLASLMVGGFMGFLFGIPKSLQKNDSDATSFTNNTNLEQISDWLTKIIVGVSLTQLPQIEQRFSQMTKNISEGFKGNMNDQFSYPYSGALVIFYAVSGFIYVYLWCIIYLRDQLNSKWAIIKDEVETNANNIELAKIQTQINDFYKQRNTIVISESSEQFKDIVEKAKPLPVTVLDDCQKNRWGGISSSKGYELSANIVSKKPEDESDETFIVTIKVTHQINNLESTFNTYLFLHDTYAPDNIKRVTSSNGVASLEIPSYEAFTIGAYIEEENLKLELDLNLYDKSPEAYKYGERLFTITELLIKKEELKKN